MPRIGQRPNSPGPGTAERILDHARRAFNERGVASVGMREIARDLDISPGNLSYHFATKEALLGELVVRMHADNNAAVAEPAGPLDLASLDALLRALMLRDYENRWLMRDCVGLIQSMPSLARLIAPMQRAREGRVDAIARRLVEAGLLDAELTARALPLLRVGLVTQVVFWLPAAILADPKRDPLERLDLHARAALALLLPACTAAGKRQLKRILESSDQSPRR